MLTRQGIQDVRESYPEQCDIIESNIACVQDCPDDYESPRDAAWENAFCHPSIKKLDNTGWFDLTSYFDTMWQGG